jgi:nucleoside 2-deoxyribosyltransferase
MYAFVIMPFRKEFKIIRKAVRDAFLRANFAETACVWADDITKAGQVTAQMMAEVRKATLCIADVTGQNPNVALEVGYAQALEKPIITLAESSNDLFFDLKDQRTIIYKRSDLEKTLCVELANWLKTLPDAVTHPEDLVGTEGHERTSVALAARRVTDTPYTFFDLFSRAREHIFVAAQNHFFLTETPARQEQLRTSLLEFLKPNRARRVDIMLCNLAAKHAVRTWTYVAGESGYEADLSLATQFFSSLDVWAQTAGFSPDQLTIRRVTFVPFSVTFVDPEDDRRAFLVLTPNGYQPENRARPCFIVSKVRNPEIFDAYWSGYHHRFISKNARGG